MQITAPNITWQGKSNTIFKKFMTFSHDVNREIKHRQRNGRLQRFATETDKAKGFGFGGKAKFKQATASQTGGC